MIGALTIAKHELARRWGVWLAALGLGVLAAIIARVADDSRLFDVCLLGAAVLSWIIAFVVGMSLLGRPLHDGRLAFYFTRPVHGATIAAGKVSAGLVLVVGMQTLLLVPSMLTFRSVGEPLEAAGPLFAIWMSIVFLATGLVVGILARSRSRWFLLDAIGGTVIALLAVMLFAQVNQAQHVAVAMEWTPEEAAPMFGRIDLLMWISACAGVAVVMGAVIRAVAIGRTDRERVHRSLAITLWPTLAVVGVVGIALAHWGLV